jgi:site-specific DNA-cytosine methylase
MRALEVFCGTKSVSKALPSNWEVVSVDLLEKFNPTIVADVATWDFREAFPPGHFDFIHLSPPCTEFSRALTTRKRDLEAGDILAKRSLEILEYFKPRFWTLENPVGLLQTRPYMQEWLEYRKLCCYCKYNEGDHPYKKQTAIWTNLPWTPRPMCTKATPCADRATHGKHIHHAQRGVKKGESSALKKTQAQLYSFPPALPREWIESIGTEIARSAHCHTTGSIGLYTGST